MMKDKKYGERPSLLQIRYLIELQQIGAKRGSVMQIADKCGVSHGPVSRFFKTCVEKGYLTKEYKFTEYGMVYIEYYKRLLRDIENFLENFGVAPNMLYEGVRQMLENLDIHILTALLRDNKKQNGGFQVMHYELMSRKFLESVLEPGNWEVSIAIFQADIQSGVKRSMASYGFESKGMIRNNKRGKWLELTLRELQGKSRINGEVLTGHMETLRYRQEIGRAHV